MNENEQKHDRLVVVGLIALIVVLVFVVQAIFIWLGRVVPAAEQPPAQSMEGSTSVQEVETDLPAPSYCPSCGEKLPDSFQWGQYCPYCGEKVE